MQNNKLSGNRTEPSTNELKKLINLHNQGLVDKLLSGCQDLIENYPNSKILHNIIGVAYQSLNKQNLAIQAFEKAIAKDARYDDAYCNLGNSFQSQGKFLEAIQAYDMAINANPSNFVAHNNLGNVYRKTGKQVFAIKEYRHALSLNPTYAEAYNNLANVFQDQGRRDEAILYYKKAIDLKPKYVEAINNMGNVLKQQGMVDAARLKYEEALRINPNYASAAWNMSGVARNINDARSWLKLCINSNSQHLEAMLVLSALDYLSGDEQKFHEIANSNLRSHPYVRSFIWIFEADAASKLCFNRWELFDFVANEVPADRPFYEFGVWRGEAFEYLIKKFRKGFGFDTFQGLPEDWHDELAGTYSSQGKIPDIAGGEFIVGKFEDTLPSFFETKRPVASVINFDADLYSSTICALQNSRSVIDESTILIFDEFLMNDNWEQDEYKALEEFCDIFNLVYDVVAFSFFSKQVAVKLRSK